MMEIRVLSVLLQNLTNQTNQTAQPQPGLVDQLIEAGKALSSFFATIQAVITQLLSQAASWAGVNLPPQTLQLLANLLLFGPLAWWLLKKTKSTLFRLVIIFLFAFFVYSVLTNPPSLPWGGGG